MRNQYLIILLYIVTLTSCEKDKTYMIYGKWVIESGEIYVENKDVYPNTYTMYHYFGIDSNGKKVTKSCLRGSDYPVYPFDIIIQDTSIWEFTNNKFIVNKNDTLELLLQGNQSLYNLKDINGQVIYYDYRGKINQRIPFTYDLNKACDKLDIQIYEMTNAPYFFFNSKLHFKRVK